MNRPDPKHLLDVVLAAARASPDPMELIERAAEQLASRKPSAKFAEGLTRGRGRPALADGPALAEVERLIAEHVEPGKAVLIVARKFAPGTVTAARHRLARKLKLRKLDKNAVGNGILSNSRV